MAKWHKGIVVENRRWTDGLTSLKINAPLGQFEAGQFVRVGLEIDDEIVARPYSLVNAPCEPMLEILFNVVPEGPLSPRLFELQKGDEVLVATNPAGFLTVSEVPEVSNLWMLATGTAIGPFLSILKGTEVWQRFERIVLCYSVRTEAELAYAQSIAELTELHSVQLCFVPIITREKIADALHIRIPLAITSGELESRSGVSLSADNSHVMICGSKEMIEDVSTVLEARDMRKHRRREPGHYTIEKYH
ncbi:MAG: ferredoxin--NADP(+) reductase [Gammaproteobacteria bacterium]|nr:MAG: ferredoxin--NADP(+) reductase [Gammaproteobacteria bacterium]